MHAGKLPLLCTYYMIIAFQVIRIRLKIVASALFPARLGYRLVRNRKAGRRLFTRIEMTSLSSSSSSSFLCMSSLYPCPNNSKMEYVVVSCVGIISSFRLFAPFPFACLCALKIDSFFLSPSLHHRLPSSHHHIL